jgi:hypothetical protein
VPPVPRLGRPACTPAGSRSAAGRGRWRLARTDGGTRGTPARSGGRNACRRGPGTRPSPCSGDCTTPTAGWARRRFAHIHGNSDPSVRAAPRPTLSPPPSPSPPPSTAAAGTDCRSATSSTVDHAAPAGSAPHKDTSAARERAPAAPPADGAPGGVTSTPGRTTPERHVPGCRRGGNRGISWARGCRPCNRGRRTCRPSRRPHCTSATAHVGSAARTRHTTGSRRRRRPPHHSPPGRWGRQATTPRPPAAPVCHNRKHNDRLLVPRVILRGP